MEVINGETLWNGFNDEGKRYTWVLQSPERKIKKGEDEDAGRRKSG